MEFEQIVYSALAFMLIYGAIIIYLIKSDEGSGKRTNIAGYMAIGPLWLIFREKINRPLTSREIFGWFFVIMLMILAAALSFTETL